MAIEHLHENNILYRDLKPENVLIDYDGHIKLTDFGLSAMNFDKNSTSQVFCGSPEYMAPEMILKQKYTRMIDYYALGALLYEMIGGIPPFYAKKRKDIFNNIVNRDPKFFKEFSSKSKDLIKRLLRKDQNKRLGYRNGISDIKMHPFFKGVDWRKLARKKIHPPYIPSMRDINFSEEFTSIPVTLNFEEEITRNERKYSLTKTPMQPQNVPNEATTFGEFAGFVMENLVEDEKSEITANVKRKNSEPPTCRNMMMFNKINSQDIDVSFSFKKESDSLSSFGSDSQKGSQFLRITRGNNF